MAEMTVGEAVEIFKHIRDTEYGKLAKERAIRKVLDMEAFNGITKEELIEVMKWERGMK